MKKLILTTLLLSLLLTACKKQSETTANTEQKTTANKATVEVLTNETKDAEDVTAEDDSSESENKSSDEDKSKTENKNATEEKETVNETDIKSLVENADYISRIRITSAGSSTDITFIEDYKGDLSNIELNIPNGLKANREYILFYVDGKDGAITPVSEDGGFIELSDSDDSRIAYLEKQFGITSAPTVTENESSTSDPTENLRNNKKNTSGVEKSK